MTQHFIILHLFFLFTFLIRHVPHKKNRVHIEETGDLIIRHVLASDEGKYQCVAHNMAATRESPAISLSVYGKKQTKDGTLYFVSSLFKY